MALVTEKTVKAYDLSQIKAGDLFYGKHRTWDEGKAGIVTSVNERQLIVQYYPGIANVANHFIIPAAEVSAGEWEARWSHDMSEVYIYAQDELPEKEPPVGETDGGEEEVPDESGTADLP